MEAERGFTLVEMIVAVGLFAVVMLVSVGALLSLVGANRKAQALQSVMDNLNISLDGMVRSIRMGSAYHCGRGSYTSVADCSNGDGGTGVDATFAFAPFCSSSCDANVRWVYWYDHLRGRIYKSENNGVDFFAITAPSVSIDSVKFYVIGTTPGDTVQPKVVIVIKGTAGAAQIKTRTTFNIQATAVERILDI